MRKNITLSLDEDFIKELDRKRGSIPRSRAIEEVTTSSMPRSAPAEEPLPMQKPPTPKAERSPKPQSGIEQLVDAGALIGVKRGSEVKHRPGCECPVCKPKKGA